MPRAQEETVLRNRVREALRGAGCFTFKIHGSPYQDAGMPDLFVAARGKSCWIETKRKGEKARRLQEHKAAELRHAGQIVFCVDTFESAMEAAREAGVIS